MFIQPPRIGIYRLTMGRFAGMQIEISQVLQKPCDCNCKPGSHAHFDVKVSMPDGSETVFDPEDWRDYCAFNGPVLNFTQK